MRRRVVLFGLLGAVLVGCGGGGGGSPGPAPGPGPGPGPARQGVFELASVQQFLAASQMAGILPADFDRDGRADVALLTLAGAVRVLRGDGAGGFSQAGAPGIPLGSVAFAVADLDADGNPDLATADTLSIPAQVSVLLGNGNGTFSVRTLPTGRGPAAVVADDFDGDGAEDLAVADGLDDRVSVFLGNGDGTFAAARTTGVTSAPRSLAAADFNGDGVLDLVSVGFVLGGGNLTVLLGNGDGTFSRADRGMPIRPTQVRAVDANRDGALDLVVSGESEALRVLLGNGDGTFAEAGGSVPAVPTDVRDVAVEDLDGDGVPDLVLTHGTPNVLSVLQGDGDGTFRLGQTLDPGSLSAPQPFFGLGLIPVGTAVADVNGDGIPDLVTANRGSNSISVFLGR